MVEDAIQRISVEHFGTVQFSSVQDDTKKLEIAKKYNESFEFVKAREVLEEILINDPFNLEALKLVIEHDTIPLLRRYNENFKHLDEEFAKGEELRQIYYINKKRIETINIFDSDKMYLDFTTSFANKLDEAKKNLDTKIEEIKHIFSDKQRLMQACDEYILYGTPTKKRKQKRLNHLLVNFQLSEFSIDNLYLKSELSIEEKINMIKKLLKQEQKQLLLKKFVICIVAVAIALGIAIEEVATLGLSIGSIIIGITIGSIISGIITMVLRIVLLD